MITQISFSRNFFAYTMQAYTR